jgi:ribosomal protein S18 acetylase RimI-like enzyme
MSDIIYRLAEEKDLERTYQVFVAATNHLHEAHNAPKVPEGKAPPARALTFRQHALKYDAQRFWVAEDAGEVIGFGVGLLRQHFCYLAALHVLPDYQGYGVGRTLLELSMGPENASGARIRTTIAESLNPVSNGLYARFGMYQWVPLMSLTGVLADRDVSKDPTVDISSHRLAYEPAHLAALASIDQQVFGVPRDIDHEYWLAQPDLAGYLFGELDNPQGYAYFSTPGLSYAPDAGAIGPATATQEGYIEVMLRFCLARMQDLGVKKVNIKMPGFCRPGLRYLLDQDLRYGRPLLLLASEPFGQMDRYIPPGSDALI